MPEVLLMLRLEGPLQSWGVRSRWDPRDTAWEPTKSGVVGLLGCACGIPRRDERLEGISDDLRMAVRADRPGTFGSDFQTAQGYFQTAKGTYKYSGPGANKVPTAPLERAQRFPAHTLVSPRDYLHDAAFLVALAGEAALLETLAAALRAPRWPLFLGRKSCVPTRPVLDSLTTEYASLQEAMEKAPWAAPSDPRTRRAVARTFNPIASPPDPAAIPPALREWAGAETWEARGPAHQLTAWVEDEKGEVERQDALRTNDLRFYDFRRVRRVSVPLHGLEVLSP